MTQSNINNIYLSADRPQAVITKDCLAKDLFGHAPFANMLAKSILGYPASTDGLVLGLYGAWGSGKSTVLNYIEYYINHPDEWSDNLKNTENTPTPVIVKFNPWWFSGQDNLIRAFFGQLQAAYIKRRKPWYRYFEKISAVGRCLIKIFIFISPVLDLFMGDLGSKFGKLLESIDQNKPKDIGNYSHP